MGIQGIVMTITSDFREGTLTVKRKSVCERESRDKRETELEEGSKIENNYSSVNASRIDDEKIETDRNLNSKGQCKRIKK